MPHIRMEIHDVLREVNDRLRSGYSTEAVKDANTLRQLAEIGGFSPAVSTAVDRLHPVLQHAVLGAIKAAAADGGRPVYLSWRHGPIQRVEVTAPSVPEIPIDVLIEGRYVEDGLPNIMPQSSA